MTPLVLALDIGTSSVRALAFDASGHKIGPTFQHAYRNHTTSDGGVEVDADELLALCVQCIDEILAAAEGEWIGVATSCFWHSLIGVDRQGSPRTKVLSWADNRAAPFVQTLRSQLDEDLTHARTGCVFHPSYWPAKFLWLHATRPELFDGQTRWMSFGEYLALRWHGQATVSFSMASGTGLFDQNALGWDDKVLCALPLDANSLSPLCDANQALSALRPLWSARWPKLHKAKWFPALGDGACSNIGSGGVDASTIAMNCGTSGALRVVLENWTGAAPRGLWRYRVDRKRSVIGGALSNAGNVLQWAHQTLNLPADWDAQIAAASPDHGLLVLPFLAGERSPLWNARARFTLEGAGLDTTPIQIGRAALEGAALRFKAVADALRGAMREAGLSPARDIIYSGGALDASPAWAQIMADCIGAPLVESHEKEASARGATLLALEALGRIGNIADLPAERGQTIVPNPTTQAHFEQTLTRQNALYEKLYGAMKDG